MDERDKYIMRKIAIKTRGDRRIRQQVLAADERPRFRYCVHVRVAYVPMWERREGGRPAGGPMKSVSWITVREKVDAL